MLSRTLLIRARRGLLLLALLCILLARAAVPAGWMPMAGTDGAVVLAPCSGMGAMAVKAPDSTMSGMAMHAAHDAGDKGDQRHPDPAGDHPCAGAGISVALETPLLDLGTVQAPQPIVVSQPVPTVDVGRGLAAPPPPATGPPSLA